MRTTEELFADAKARYMDKMRKIKREELDGLDSANNIHVRSARPLTDHSIELTCIGCRRPPLTKPCKLRLLRWSRGNLFNNRGRDRRRNMHLYVFLRRIRHRTTRK